MIPFARRLVVGVVVGAALTLSFAACKPKPGQGCSAGQAACEDAKNALSCVGGKFTEIPCKGGGGCTIDRTTKKVSCDDSVADEGDSCLTSQTENWACTPDHKTALICEDNKFKVNLQCRGKDGCKLNQFTEIISCDIKLQQKGDPCPKPGIGACSTDFKQMLVCKDGKFDTFRYCRGQDACHLVGSEPFCDESIAELNDPCGKVGLIACSSDGKTELRCESGRFVHSRDCKKVGCSLMNGRPNCQ